MQEHIFGKRKCSDSERTLPQKSESKDIPNSVYCDVMAGRRHATSEMVGHRQDLAPSMEAKMSRAFGMDLKGIRLYRSDAMDGEMQGLASGNRIVLSRDINLNTMQGQAVLGHEISHIRAQSQGIGLGHTGLYDNAALEHRADTEGMLAAHGQSILEDTPGMAENAGISGISGLAPLGPGLSVSAGAPMQASGKKKKKPVTMNDSVVPEELGRLTSPEESAGSISPEGYALLEDIDVPEGKEKQVIKEQSWRTKVLENAYRDEGLNPTKIFKRKRPKKEGVPLFDAYNHVTEPMTLEEHRNKYTGKGAKDDSFRQGYRSKVSNLKRLGKIKPVMKLEQAKAHDIEKKKDRAAKYAAKAAKRTGNLEKKYGNFNSTFKRHQKKNRKNLSIKYNDIMYKDEQQLETIREQDEEI